ncbi:hypothetical protein [Prosthecobacter fluviatilis]|uniref:Toprim domain-containing protein n=1 Tax=Prosthecobacter fluviatilis TaxID=445931 RepID=A0ABW0KYL1_9BACT
MKTITERASAYLARVPASISGPRAQAAAARAALALVRGFGLSEPEALPLLTRWNAACQPPWQEKELRHLLRTAAASTERPAGYLLEAQRPQGAEAGNRPDRPDRPHKTHASSQSPAAAPAPAAPALPEAGATAPAPAEDIGWLREMWPEFHPLTREDIRAVAEQRGLLPDAVDLAHRHGFLRVAQVQGHRCLVITEGTFAQVRRLDGKPLEKADGSRIQTRNLSGSQGAFIGQGWLGETTHVLLVEDAVGLLEGLAAMLLVDTPHAWSILAATGASARFARDSGLLERLRGREVHLLPDTDEAGLDAGATWLADLRAAGVQAAVHLLPAPCKDLGEVLQLPEADRQPILESLFSRLS